MQVQEGEGWRLVIDDRRHPFAVLLGGPGWAADFTVAEVALLRRGLGRLLAQHRSLADQLMAEESLTLEWEAEGLWLELESGPALATLRFILTAAAPRRSIEAGWTAAAAAALAAALEALNLPPGPAADATDQQP